MKIWPRSLFGRIALILFAGLGAAHALAFWSILRERGELAEAMLLAYVGRDVASSVAILDRIPAAERPAWLPRLERRNYRYTLGALAAGTPAAAGPAKQVAAVVAAELGGARPIVATQGSDGGLILQLQLADGAPLSLTLRPPAMTISAATAALLLLQLAMLAAVSALAVRLATRPLAQLATAAARLGPGLHGMPLPEDGPLEVVQATTAFNAMQRRIADHLEERMQILAAISHDLQTPITRMRVRADLLGDTPLRDKLQGDLSEMQSLVEEGLAYARSAHAVAETARPLDLHALLDSLVCDCTDAGHRLHLCSEVAARLTTRPQALRRVVMNLVDNALKFAGEAQILVSLEPAEVHIAVCDCGPGIPESELAGVLQPFHRVERSRNRETGGAGLGLAIAQQLANALQGRLVLSNRPQGGLEARLSLPRVM